MSTAGRPDLADAAWFAVDLDVPAASFRFLELAPSVLEDSVFLDTRIGAALADAVPVPAAEVAAGLAGIAAPPPAFLFHTSFCCSTLLARALHLPPHCVALKEPLLLRRLADARRAGFDPGRLGGLALALLARPWNPGGRVLIKPTHAALNIAAELLALAPAARAIVLYGPLEEFLISNIKKPPETQAKVAELAERALLASGLHQRLPRAALEPPDFLGGVALQWCAQLELAAQVLAGPGGGRVRALREPDLLADLGASARKAAAWLGLELPQAELGARVAAVSRRHAKQPDAAYDSTRREAEAARLRQMFGADIAGALRWAERLLFPAMRGTELAPLL